MFLTAKAKKFMSQLVPPSSGHKKFSARPLQNDLTSVLTPSGRLRQTCFLDLEVRLSPKAADNPALTAICRKPGEIAKRALGSISCYTGPAGMQKMICRQQKACDICTLKGLVWN